MVLDAPGVVSNVRERDVRPPAPMRIALGGGGGGGSLRGEGRRLGVKGAGGGEGLGGFPAVRHRSEMGVVKLGGGGAAAAAAIKAAAKGG